LSTGELRNSSAAAESFEGAGFSVTHRPGVRKSDVSDLACIAGGSLVQSPIEYQPGPHAGTVCKKDHIARTAPSAELPLREGARVGIVHQVGISTELLNHFAYNLDTIPAGKIRGRQYGPRRSIQGAAARNAEQGT
jgi:hypothetical protein